MVIGPARIGIDCLGTLRFGRVAPALCHASLQPLDSSDVVSGPRRALPLADLSAVRRQWLATRRPFGIRAPRDCCVVVFDNEERLRLTLSGFELRRRDELVLEISGDVRPLPSHRFPCEHP